MDKKKKGRFVTNGFFCEIWQMCLYFCLTNTKNHNRKEIVAAINWGQVTIDIANRFVYVDDDGLQLAKKKKTEKIYIFHQRIDFINW